MPAGDSVRPAVELLRRWRLGGLAYAWAARHAGRDAEFAQALEPTFREQQLAGAILQETAGRALEALTEANIPVLLFKGAGLIRSGEYAVGERPMDDVDLIVSPRQAERAAEVLVEVGFEPWSEWQRARERWSDTFTLRDRAAPEDFPCDLDLHWRTEYGALRFGAGGSPLWLAPPSDHQTPAPEPHLLVVAEHFLKHLRVRPHLLAYADLLRLCTAVDEGGQQAWMTLVELAEKRWWTPAIGVLLEVLREDLGAPVPDGVSEAFVAERPAILRLKERLKPAAHLEGAGPSKRLDGIGERWQMGPGPAGAARELWGAVFPPPAWLEARYGSGSLTRLRLRHGGAVLRWAVGKGVSPLSPNQEGPKILDSGDLPTALDPVDTPLGRL